MGKLIPLRVARWVRGRSDAPSHPHLEALVEQECDKVGDGFHYARWIVPLVCMLFALGCFLPLAITVDPRFWIGTAALTVVGGGLGVVFNALANRISPSQLRMRKRCLLLGNRMVGFNNLLGVTPTLSPRVAEILDEAAMLYLSVRPTPEEERAMRTGGVWSDAKRNAQLAMEEAMAQMLRLAEPETPQAQDVELLRGWAEPLLLEMRATASALAHPSEHGLAIEAATPLANLAEARSHLERLGSAAEELDRQSLHERA